MRADYTTTVLGQPQALEASAAHVRSQLRHLDPLPWTSGVLGVVGMGASGHAAHLMVDLLAAHGRRVVALSAAEFLTDQSRSPADCYLLVSESGESVETVHAAKKLRGAPRLGLTNTSSSPLLAELEAHVDLGCGQDSAVYTIGYTATLQAFALMAQWLGVSGTDVDVTDVPAFSRDVLAAGPGAVEGLGELLTHARAVDVVGHGSHLAAAGELALMLREACRVPATCHDTYEYLHGPMEWLDSNSACILFGSGREVELAEYVSTTGATTVLITNATVTTPPGVRALRIPGAGAAATAVLEMLPMHHLLKDLATRRNLAIDGFRYHQHDTKLSPQY